MANARPADGNEWSLTTPGAKGGDGSNVDAKCGLVTVVKSTLAVFSAGQRCRFSAEDAE